MKEYKTEHGTTLFYKVFYDIGGFNYFTYTNRARGYYLSVQRKHNCFSAFSDLSNPDGAVKVLLKEVKRQSAKALAEAEAEAENTLSDIVATYNDRGIEL